MKCITASSDHTEKLGRTIGTHLSGGTVLRIIGGLGMGKTVLARGIARGLGICEPVTSPSYTIIEEYPGSPGLVHIDLYRIHDPEEIDEIGIIEYIGSSEHVLLIEWADKAPVDMFGPAYEVRIEPGHTPEERHIHITPDIDLVEPEHD